MEAFYDTVVIGAGPAGMSCGITLQAKQKSVCVIEKAVFPRRKTCAGLVTGKTYRLLQILFAHRDIRHLFCDTVTHLRLFSQSQFLTDAPLLHPVRLVNRGYFDNALAEYYQSLGGTLLEGERNIRIDYAQNRIVLSDGRALRYRNLIFADGALSMAHKTVRVDRSRLAFGVEAYIPAEQLPVRSVDLYYDYVDDGYLWVFPHQNTVCVGVAGYYNKKVDYSAVLTRFLKEKGINVPKSSYIGAFLPYGYLVPQQKLPRNVMLIGDAGGFTDPVTGEGLYMALKTGMLAAQATQEASPKKAYLQSTARLARYVTEGKRVQKLFYTPSLHRKFIRKVKGNPKPVTMYFDRMIDEYRCTYRELPFLYRAYKRAKKGSK